MRSRRRAFGVDLLVLLAGCGVVWLRPPSARAQQAPQDPQALALINQGLALLNGGTALSDVTLQATVTYTSGSDLETGTATLQALGNTNDIVVLNLTLGQQQEVRNSQAGVPAGAWVYPDNTVSLYAFQNCWTDAAWFSPGLILTSMPANPQVGLVNVGAGTWNGLSVNHVQSYQLLSAQSPSTTALIEGLSLEDLYLDATSELPLAIDFNLHPDGDLTTNIALEVQFGNYQTVNGMSVPFHVQRFVNGSLFLDFTVTSVTVNSGLLPGVFNIP